MKLRLLGKIEVRDFLLGSYPLVGRHVVNEPALTEDIGRRIVSELMHLRLYSGPLTAVEYLANFSRNTLIVLKSFKAMILGSNFI